VRLVVEVDHNTKYWGLYDSNINRITLVHSICDTQHVVEVLLHEISHAIYDKSKLEDTDLEERIVATFSIGWTQIYRDNPWLTAWIAKFVR
jgi:hypothetical protein